jgi:hypothetical protein
MKYIAIISLLFIAASKSQPDPKEVCDEAVRRVIEWRISVQVSLQPAFDDPCYEFTEKQRTAIDSIYTNYLESVDELNRVCPDYLEQPWIPRETN